MKRTRGRLLSLSAFSILSLVNLALCKAEGPYHFLKEIAVSGEGGWDYLSIDETNRRLYVSHATKVVASIALPGKPEFAVCDPKAGRVYCKIEDKNEVVVIDTKSHEVVNTWPIAPGAEASGMAFDLGHHRLFLGCGNELMVMMDSANGKVVATVPIGQGVDANAFDPGTQLAFSSNGEGTVTIAHEDAPEKLTVVQTLKTERGARTMALDPKTHKIYLGSAKYEPSGAVNSRPKIISGSFKILVYGMEKTAGQ